MSRSFLAASSKYLEYAHNPWGADGANLVLPVSISCWFWTTPGTTDYVLVFVGNAGSATAEMGIALDVHPSTGLRALQSNDVGGGGANTNVVPSVASWHHACGVFSATTSRTAYLDGTNKVNNATNIAVVQNRLTDIGICYYQTLANGYMNGLIAEVAFWSGVSLSDAEVAALARGASPLRIQPGYLTHYWPLRGLDSPERNLAMRLQNSNNPNALFNLSLYNNPGRGGDPPRPADVPFWIETTAAPAVTARSFAVIVG